MDSYLKDVLDVCLRLLHVMAGIAWIGASLYFIRLDLKLRPPREPKEGVGGEDVVVDGQLVHADEAAIAQEHRRQAAKLPA